MDAKPSVATHGRVIARLARETERALASLELTLPQYRVLLLLSTAEEGASSLANKLGVSNASVTGVVDVLVGRALVVRRQSAEDRRCVRHQITLNGRRLLERADVAIEQRLGDLASQSAEGGQELFTGLDRWGEAFRKNDDALLAETAAVRSRA